MDSQPRQLADGLQYIKELRSNAGKKDLELGTIHTATLESLKVVLEDSWLVVEVSFIPVTWYLLVSNLQSDICFFQSVYQKSFRSNVRS